VPFEVVYPRWSLSYPGANFTNATVTMTSGSSTIPVTKEPVSDPTLIIGEPTIAWRPNGLASDGTWPQPAQDTRYTIKITGAIVGGASKTFQYDVIVFDPSTNPPPPPSPVCQFDHNSARNGISIVESCTGFKGGETVDIFWERTSSTPLASFVANSAGAGSAAFKVPTSTGGIHRVIAKGRTSKTLDNLNFHVLSGISLSPKSGLSGSSFKVTLTGFGASETITIKWYQTGTSTVTLTSSLISASTGGASKIFTVPNSTTGAHLVEASGNAGNIASYNFTVTGPGAASEPTKSPTPISTATPSATATGEATAEPTATDTATLEPSPSETATEMPTQTPTEEPTATPTDEPLPTETPIPEEAPEEPTA
jgi:hypothetical protein